MKNKVRITITAVAMMLVFAIPSVGQPSLGKAMLPPAAEDQPKMKEAINHLNQAKSALAQAMHDKGGHRAKAIAHIDQAIREVEAGMAYSEQHEKKH